MGKQKITAQWDRVSGPDLDPNNAPRMKRNEGVLKSKGFIAACHAAGVEPTKRQASKWSNKKGAAYKHK